MSRYKILFSVILILFGVFIFVYGGADDSPGAQLLGLVIVIATIVNLVRGRKKNLS